MKVKNKRKVLDFINLWKPKKFRTIFFCFSFFCSMMVPQHVLVCPTQTRTWTTHTSTLLPRITHPHSTHTPHHAAHQAPPPASRITTLINDFVVIPFICSRNTARLGFYSLAMEATEISISNIRERQFENGYKLLESFTGEVREQINKRKKKRNDKKRRTMWIRCAAFTSIFFPPLLSLPLPFSLFSPPIWDRLSLLSHTLLSPLPPHFLLYVFFFLITLFYRGCANL